MPPPTAPPHTDRYRIWFVSAPHGRLTRNNPGEPRWVPFGKAHARQVGSSFTACGQPALGWKLFWDMPFPDSDAETCAECRELVSSPRNRPGPAEPPLLPTPASSAQDELIREIQPRGTMRSDTSGSSIQVPL